MVLNVQATTFSGLGYHDRLAEWASWCRSPAWLGPAPVRCFSAETAYVSPQRELWDSAEERLERIRRLCARPNENRAYEVELAVRTLDNDPVGPGTASPRKVFRIDVLVLRGAGESYDQLAERKRRLCLLPEHLWLQVCINAHESIKTALGYGNTCG